jgi:hypothetical protein
MRFCGRLVGTSWRRELAVSRTMLADLGATAMAATASTLGIEATTLVRISRWVGSEYRGR